MGVIVINRDLGDMEMKGILISILLFLLCISVESVSADTISAQIDSQDFPSGNWHQGQDQADAHVWIKNTGDVGHRFWVSYEVMDRRGRVVHCAASVCICGSRQRQHGLLALACIFLMMRSWAHTKLIFIYMDIMTAARGSCPTCWIKLPKWMHLEL